MAGSNIRADGKVGMCSLLSITLLCCVNPIGAVQASNVMEKVRVSIRVVDTEGKPLGEARIDVQGEGLSKTILVNTRGFLELPYGSYLFTCSAPGYIEARREVSVRGPKTEVLFGLALLEPEQHLGEGPLVPFQIRGFVMPTPGRGEIVVAKLIGVYSEEVLEAFVTEEGKFLMPVYRQGHYRMWVLRGGKISWEDSIHLDISVPKIVELRIKTGRAE